MSEELDTDVLDDVVSRLLTERCTPDVVRQAETDGGFAPSVWESLAEAGLPWVSIDESAGGSGGTPAQALRLLHHAGRAAAPVPLAETGFLAGWLLAGAGLEVGQQPTTVAVGTPADEVALTVSDGTHRLDAALHRVPWGRFVDDVVLLADLDGRLQVVRAPVADAEVAPDRNVAGEPRDTLTFRSVAVDAGRVAAAADGVDADALLRRGALARAALMAGAMERASELAVEHATTRHQFGRPIARFQAVQQHLVIAAEEAQLAVMAAAVAARQMADVPSAFAAATAKIVAGDGSRVVTKRSHQVHGAMGMTQEHELHLRTRRLWAWEAEFGHTEQWRRRLGADVFEAGPDALWPRIASGLTA